MIESSFSLGDWLNLIARLPHDPDLAPLVNPIDTQFAAAVRREADSQLRSAIRLFDSGQALESSKRCDQIAALMKHIEPEVQSTLRSETEKLVSRIVSQNGVTIKMIRGTFAFGSQSSYVSDLWPILLEARRSQGLSSRQAVLSLAQPMVARIVSAKHGCHRAARRQLHVVAEPSVAD